MPHKTSLELLDIVACALKIARIPRQPGKTSKAFSVSIELLVVPLKLGCLFQLRKTFAVISNKGINDTQIHLGVSSDDPLYFDCHLCGLAREDLAGPNQRQCKICTWCDKITIGDDLHQEYKWCHCGGDRIARFFFILDDREYTYCSYCRVQEALPVPDLANVAIRPSLSPVHSHASYGWVVSTLTQAVTPSCPSSTPSQDLDNPFVISPSGSSQPYLRPLDSSSSNRQPVLYISVIFSQGHIKPSL